MEKKEQRFSTVTLNKLLYSQYPESDNSQFIYF